MEKLMAEAIEKKRNLDNEMTNTLTSQVIYIFKGMFCLKA